MTQMPPANARDLARFEAVATIYSRLLGTSVVNILNAALLVAVITDRGGARGAIEWLGLITLLSIARIMLYVRYRADAGKRNRTRHWERLAVAGSFLAIAMLEFSRSVSSRDKLGSGS